MKCEICSLKIESTFLEKIKGTYIKKKGKLKAICPACQQKYAPEELLGKV
jgi:hypothetical protein